MPAWSIEAITLHRVLVPGPEVFFQRGFNETIELFIHAFLLRDGHGRACLVDTGLPSDHEALDRDIRARKGPLSGFVDTGAGLQAELARRAVKPAAILLTSFGPYATGGLPFLPDVPVHASARGCASLVRPEEPALAHPLAGAIHDRLVDAHRIDGQLEVFPGLTMVEVGVHHPASTAILVETGAGRIAIADPVFVRRSLVDGLALGAAEHAAGWHTMVRKLGRRCDAIIPVHDGLPVPVDRSAWHRVLDEQADAAQAGPRPLR